MAGLIKGKKEDAEETSGVMRKQRKRRWTLEAMMKGSENTMTLVLKRRKRP